MSAPYTSMRSMLLKRFLILLGILQAAGCADKITNGTISGKVLYDGKPLPGGTVVFVTDGKGSFSSSIEPDGSYHISRVSTGPVKIMIQGPPRPPDMPGGGMIPSFLKHNDGPCNDCPESDSPLESLAPSEVCPEQFPHSDCSESDDLAKRGRAI